MEDFTQFIVNAILFFIAYKLGQFSMLGRITEIQRSEIQQKLAEVRQTGHRPMITIEEINGIYYAYDGNDFLAQGKDPHELGTLIAQRFPNKYQLAQVKVKA
jgi:hypothetical protein